MSIDILAWVLVYAVAAFCLSIGSMFFTWIFFAVMKSAISAYVKLKSDVWVVRRWSEQEKVIKKLEIEIAQLKKEVQS